jgi:hypothetical protein
LKTNEITPGNGSDVKIRSHNNSSDWLLAQVAHVTQTLADCFPIGCTCLELDDDDSSLLIEGSGR